MKLAFLKAAIRKAPMVSCNNVRKQQPKPAALLLPYPGPEDGVVDAYGTPLKTLNEFMRGFTLIMQQPGRPAPVIGAKGTGKNRRFHRHFFKVTLQSLPV